MLRYLYGQDDMVAQFVAQMIPHVRSRGFGKCRAIGVVNGDNKLIAGLVYHVLLPAADVMEISLAALPGQRWITRQTLSLAYRYPFEQCGCQMVVMTLPATKTRHRRMLKALGHTFVTVPRLFGRERDGVLALLTEEAWRANPICRRSVKDVETSKAAA